jgi:hypothetical protein
VFLNCLAEYKLERSDKDALAGRIQPLPFRERAATGWKFGDILGTRNRCLGMVRKLLTDARETSYVILSSLLKPNALPLSSGELHNTTVFILLQQTDSCYDHSDRRSKYSSGELPGIILMLL